MPPFPPFFPPFPHNIVYPSPLTFPSPVDPKEYPFHPENCTNSPEGPETGTPLNKEEGPVEEVLQLTNRNVLPNNVSLALCYIRRVKKSGRMVQHIISRLSPDGQYTSKRFYAYQLYLKENCTDFKWKEGIQTLASRLDSDCPSFSLAEQAFYNKVTRVLLASYLEQICRLEVLNHSKINPSHIRDHLKVIRYVRKTLRCDPAIKTTIQYNWSFYILMLYLNQYTDCIFKSCLLSIILAHFVLETSLITSVFWNSHNMSIKSLKKAGFAYVH